MADRVQVPRDQALAVASGLGRIWFRLAAIQRSGEWHTSAFELTSGVAPTGWQSRAWRYEEALFLAGQTDGTTVAAWFGASEARIEDAVIKLPPLQDNINCERRSSRQKNQYQALEWPSLTYDLGQWSGGGVQAPEPLISDGAPSFLTHAKAASSFFGVDMGNSGERSINLRVQDLVGRITSVVVTALELTVSVEGPELRDARVELASDVEGPSQPLGEDDPQTVTFPLAGPPPPNAWVLLTRGSNWIDRKFLRTIHTMNVDPGVEYIVEPETEVRSLIAQGETSMIEFKRDLPELGAAGRKLRLDIAGTVAAFANQDGGWLLLGVANDGSIDGVVAPGSEDQARVTIINFLKDIITPLADFDVQTHDIDGRTVMVIEVSQGATPPFGVDHRNPRYFVRRGATTFPASAEAVRQLARSRPPSDGLARLG